MARGQVHVGQVGHVPGAHDDAAGIGVVLDGFHGLLDLVDVPSVVIGPGPPLVAVNVPQVTGFLVGPFVPDAYSVGLQIGHVGVSLEEPE